jgi:hypothetical protein
MSHRAQQPSTASSSFHYSSFDPSSSSTPPRLSDYSTYSYDHGGSGYEYEDFTTHDSPAIDRAEGGGGESGETKGKPSRRNDSIFSFTSLGVGGDIREGTHVGIEAAAGGGAGEGGAFEGEEYRNNPFETDRGRRKKRYGLSDSDTIAHGEGDYSTDDDDSDLEVFDLQNSLPLSAPSRSASTTTTKAGGGGGGLGRRHTRFERLTAQELGWMGISALCVVGLTAGAVVVAIVG